MICITRRPDFTSICILPPGSHGPPWESIRRFTRTYGMHSHAEHGNEKTLILDVTTSLFHRRGFNRRFTPYLWHISHFPPLVYTTVGNLLGRKT